MLHAEAIHGPPENSSKIFHHYKCSGPGRCPNETNTYHTRGDGAAVSYTPLFVVRMREDWTLLACCSRACCPIAYIGH
jgi:hypothetical protein